jgi:starch-binding outer membrane protein, SusD/RagB family
MKNIQKYILTAFLFVTFGCEKILEEHPQSQIVPSFFNSSAGVLGGIAGVYNDIRAFWGTEAFTAEIQAGTDEFVQGASSGAGPAHTYNGLNGTNFNNAWGTAFTDINTLNGVLKFGAELKEPEATKKAYLAQAKFLRGFWYFYLVQTWGDVPLHTEFITTASQAAKRDPAADVYKLVIQDFRDAAADLPLTPAAPFLGKPATQAVAKFFLAKALLTRGWLTNSQADFAEAAKISSEIIADKGKYNLDLWADFEDAFVPANDYGKESMFVSDHVNDPKYGYYTVGGGAAGGAAQNLTPWLTNLNYPAVSGVNANKNASGVLANSGTTMLVRDSFYGRPYIRMRPNTIKNTNGKNYFFDQAFVNRNNDTRFSKTFYLTYIANKVTTNAANAAGNTRGIGYTVAVGDTAMLFTDYEVEGAPQFMNGKPFKGLVIPPSLYNNNYFPAIKKFMDPSRGANFNDPSTRPCVLTRFAEVYLIGAEAYHKAGDNEKQLNCSMLCANVPLSRKVIVLHKIPLPPMP